MEDPAPGARPRLLVRLIFWAAVVLLWLPVFGALGLFVAAAVLRLLGIEVAD